LNYNAEMTISINLRLKRLERETDFLHLVLTLRMLKLYLQSPYMPSDFAVEFQC